MTIAICSSANFYRQVVDIQAELKNLGFDVLIPRTAEQMKQTGDFDVHSHRTWLTNAADYHKKTALMKEHFPKIEQSDAVLVVNHKKNGTTNYIGGNVLMEMAVAFYLNKLIFLLNDIPQKSPFLEEVIGMNPIMLHGKIIDVQKHIS